MMPKTNRLIPVFLALLIASVMHADTGVLSIVVKDVKTHSAVQAKIRVEGPKALETETDKDGKLTLSLPAGEYQITAAALGYSSMTWRGTCWARPSATPAAEIFLFPAFAEAPVTGGTGVASIQVRDWLTHYAVPAKIELEGPKSLSLETDGNGTITLPSGEYLEKVSAPGYKTMWWDSLMIRPGNANLTGLGATLVSVKPRPEEESEQAQLRPGYTLFVGYATDEQGHPVAGVRVRFKNAGAETTTNERGYYSLSILTPPEKTMDVPATDTFTAEKPGYKTIVHYNVEVESEGPGGIALDMKHGSGTIEENDLPMALRPTDEHQRPEDEQPSPATPKGDRETSPQSLLTIGGSLVPGSIKVGFGCPRDPCQWTDPNGPCYHTQADCTNNYPHGCAICPNNRWHEPSECTDPPQTFVFETYVQQGLQSEWSHGWKADSLQAGAVAYRTYGAYFQQHPGRSGSSNYDIRSDECNQSFAVTRVPPWGDTSGAARATTGVALSDDGGAHAYFSEYSKDGNNHGCGDGNTGDNINWPCMNDPIAAGSPFAGTGRGMSQWGSQYWARGRSYQGQSTPAPGWQCILDHYYNDNGNSTGAGDRHTYRYSFLYGPGGDGLIAFTPANFIPRSLASPMRSGRRAKPAENTCYTYQTPSDLYTLPLDGSTLFDVNPDQSQCSAYPSWDPTQQQIAYDPFTLQVGTIDASGLIPFTPLNVSGEPFWPAWSQQNLIAYFDFDSGGLYSVPPTGGQGFLIVADPNVVYPLSWSPTGAQVLYATYGTPCCNYLQIAVADANGGGFQQFLTGELANAWSPAWSPDLTQIVYLSDQGGSTEVWIMQFDGTLQHALTSNSTSLNFTPRWSQDGHYIIWLSGTPSAVTLNFMSPDGTNAHSYGPLLPWGNAAAIDTTRCRRFDSL